MLKRIDLFNGLTEEEEIVRTNHFADFNVGAVEGSDGECTVHGKFHVARSGGFLTCGGDLLGEIRSWIDLLTQLHVVVRQKHHPESTVHVRIGIDGVGDAINKANDQLRHVVARRSLTAKQHRARCHVTRLPILDPQVLGDDLQGVQVLALVFVNALHLHIKEGGRIHQHTGVAVDVAGQLPFHGQLGACPMLKKCLVVLAFFEFA